MGTLTNAYAALLQQYGKLGVRFNTLGQFYDCVRDQVNNHKSPDSCL
jgi:hypothetical protein